MHYFFRPKSRVAAPLWVARMMNTLNILGPVLLLAAIVAGSIARFGDMDVDARQWLLRFSVLLAVAALVIRAAWGVSVRWLYKRYTARKDT